VFEFEVGLTVAGMSVGDKEQKNSTGDMMSLEKSWIWELLMLITPIMVHLET
jgi:hypothetical protein